MLNLEPAPEQYTWSFPGCPVRAQLSLDFVARLQFELAQAKPGEDVGGLLIGWAASPNSMEINDFKPLASRPGASGYPFTESVRQEIESCKAQLTQENKSQKVVGYYRTTPQDLLRLDKEDLALMRDQFSDPSNLCLVIGKKRVQQFASAGFFFWENGAVEGNFCFNEFPFDAECLRTEALEQQLAAIKIAEPQELDLELIEPPKFLQSGGGGSKRDWIKPLLACAAVAVLAVAGYFAWTRFGPVTTEVANSPLGLRVYAQGTDLRLIWDRNARVLQFGHATGNLTILDGDIGTREIPLADEDLRATGSIVYSPISERVRFRLNINGLTEDVSETVLSIKGRSSVQAIEYRKLEVPRQSTGFTPENAASGAGGTTDDRQKVTNAADTDELQRMDPDSKALRPANGKKTYRRR